MKTSNPNPVFIRRIDIVIALAIMLLAAAGWLAYRGTQSGKRAVAEIYADNTLIAAIDLTERKNREFTLPQLPSIVFLQDESGGIRFLLSDCPDQVCVHTGRVSLPGEFAACLPNKALIRLVSDSQDAQDGSEPDIIIGG